MIETHAPYAVGALGDNTKVYGKTTKTACYRRLATEKLVARGEQTCQKCQRQISADRAHAERRAARNPYA